MWNGSSIGAQYQTLVDVAEAVNNLCPPSWTEPGNSEWLVKAGEGGNWQATWDGSPLAIGHAARLRDLVDQGQPLGIEVIPYYVVRGRDAWRTAEISQIQQCAHAASRVVLNLEPGASYFNGQPTVDWVNRWFDELDLDPAKLELCAIPRAWCGQYLGGPAVMQAWLTHVSRASWECYDSAAADLSPDTAIDLVRNWGADRPELQVIVVQRSRISAWADSPLASGGMEVWHLDGD